MTPVEQEVPEDVLETLKGKFNELFAPDKVVAVRAAGGTTWDGDVVVRIDIVFEELLDENGHPDFGVPDMEKASGIGWRIIRPVLEKAGDDRRPLCRYLTVQDIEEMDNEPA